MDTKDEDEYARRHELSRFELEWQVMNANLNATLEGIRADMARFFAASAERELKREQEAAARELRREQEAAARELRREQEAAERELRHQQDMAKRETRLIWALVAGFALLGTVLGVLIRLPVI